MHMHMHMHMHMRMYPKVLNMLEERERLLLPLPLPGHLWDQQRAQPGQSLSQSCQHLQRDRHTKDGQTAAKPAESQKKLKILGDGLAKQSEPQQCKFQLESLLVSLTSISSAVQASVF